MGRRPQGGPGGAARPCPPLAKPSRIRARMPTEQTDRSIADSSGHAKRLDASPAGGGANLFLLVLAIPA